MSLNRDVAEILKVIHAPDRPARDTLSPEGARASYIGGQAATPPEPMQVAKVRDLSIPGPHGQIPLRLYRPAGAPAAASAALAFFHGGGRVLGKLNSHDPLRGEGEAYKQRLVEAGIQVTVWRASGLIHGSLPMGKAIAASGPALDRLAAAPTTGLAA